MVPFMAEPMGQVVMLVGTSSAGKTSTAVALQGCLEEHHLLVGFDVFLGMVDSSLADHRRTPPVLIFREPISRSDEHRSASRR